MSNLPLPTMAGLMWDRKKIPRFNSKVQTSVNLSELRGSFTATPVYEFRFAYDVLRQGTITGQAFSELNELCGFFLARQGKFDSWLYEDPNDFSVSAQLIGTGNGSNTVFYLQRTLGGFTERVAQANVVTNITLNNTPTSNYVLASNGMITFNSAPGANVAVRWSGTYRYRCRFLQDTSEFNEFMHRLFDMQSLEFIGSLGTKV